MRAPSPERRAGAAAALAAAGWALMLAVLAASAYIRMSDGPGPGVDLARAVHRASASLAGLAVLLLAGWALWRRRLIAPALGALALTVFLALLGRAAGFAPAPGAALGNLAGGAALAALLAWIFGRAGAPLGAAAAERRMAPAVLAVAALQAGFGAWQATFLSPGEPTLVPWLHAATGAAVAALAAFLGVRLGRAGTILIILCAAAAGAGIASLLFEMPTLALLAHPLAAVLLVSALARLAARIA